MKVIIVGPYPPPYGGISVHVKRMKQYLESKNINVVLYNESKEFKDISKNIMSINSYKKFIFKIPFLKADIMQFHSIDKKIRILLGFYGMFNKKIILSLHGESMHDQIQGSNFIVKWFLYKSLNRLDFITCSNNKIKRDLISFGIKQNKIEVIPEYIKPYMIEEDNNSLPGDIWNFINTSKFLISANGWIRFYKGQDLYGTDMLIDLIYKLKCINIEVKLVLALLGSDSQNEEEKRYYYGLKDRIHNLKIEKNIYIFESKDNEFYPILSRSQLFVRPTNTDGNSVSVMEAIDLKIPCIVSDACPRPNGVTLFKTRDIDSLIEKTLNVIQNYTMYKEKINNIILEDNAEKLLKVYKNIIED